MITHEVEGGTRNLEYETETIVDCGQAADYMQYVTKTTKGSPHIDNE